MTQESDSKGSSTSTKLDKAQTIVGSSADIFLLETMMMCKEPEQGLGYQTPVYLPETWPTFNNINLE
jgi:hypothetical protein